MNRILIPVDFTPFSEFAVEVGASIAKKEYCEIILLHIVDRPSSVMNELLGDNYLLNHPEVLNLTSMERLKKLAEMYKIRQVRFVEKERYDVFNTTLRCAEKYNVDLIIMGAYGHNGKEDGYIGVNTERVMRKANTPVLIIKQRYNNFNLKNLVFASMFYGDIYHVFNKILNVIKSYDPKIHLLKVNTPSKFQRTQDTYKLMDEFIEHFKLHKCSKNIYNDQLVETGIINFSDSINADLIAITTHGNRRLANFFNNSISDKVVNETVKAVLSIKISQPPPDPNELFFDVEYQTYKRPEFYEFGISIAGSY